VPFVAPGKLDVETVSVAGAAAATTIESFAVLVSAGLPESVAFTVKLLVPVAVGVPEIRPVVDPSVKPAGRLPLEMVQA
jgi:hypothetical protein